MHEPNLNETCILQTRFGLKQLLWARWISPREAQVHDGKRIVARLAFDPTERKSCWIVDILDTTQPNHSWLFNRRTVKHSTPELAWDRMLREATKSWTAANPDA